MGLIYQYGPLLMAQGIDFNAFLARQSPDDLVEKFFDAVLPHDAALVQFRKLRLFQLLRRNFAHIAQDVRRGHPAEIIAA